MLLKCMYSVANRFVCLKLAKNGEARVVNVAGSCGRHHGELGLSRTPRTTSSRHHWSAARLRLVGERSGFAHKASRREAKTSNKPTPARRRRTKRSVTVQFRRPGGRNGQRNHRGLSWRSEMWRVSVTRPLCRVVSGAFGCSAPILHLTPSES